ncbi:MAG: glycosyltransferase [Microgenomates group bacterium]
MKNLKIAIVYDKINTWGGAERVLLALHEIFPQAPLYTSVFNEKKASWAKVFPQVIPSFLQKFPLAKTQSHWYTLLMPLAFESFNFGDYEVVISVTSGEAKGIITKPQTLHLCYCLTPTRYLWVEPGYELYQHFGMFNKLIHALKPPFLRFLKKWDEVAAQRPDAYATTCKTIARRILKFYRRQAKIITPFVDTDFFQPGKPSNSQNYFLAVGRLVPYKRFDIAIEACQKLGLRLKIVGDGPDFNLLEKKVKSLFKNGWPLVEMLGLVDDKELLKLYQNCQALLMPQKEDFGLVALEAQACGKPVIAFRAGGARETILDGKTGLFFSQQTPESLVGALKKFSRLHFDPKTIRAHAKKYSLEKFKNRFKKWVIEEYDKSSIRRRERLIRL